MLSLKTSNINQHKFRLHKFEFLESLVEHLSQQKNYSGILLYKPREKILL